MKNEAEYMKIPNNLYLKQYPKLVEGQPENTCNQCNSYWHETLCMTATALKNNDGSNKVDMSFLKSFITQ